MSLPKLPDSYQVFDLESTGVLPTSDRICEIAIVRVDCGAITSEWSTLVNPGVPIPAGATAIHKITDADVAGAPMLADVLPDLFARLFEGVPVLAHNGARFDVPMLRAELSRLGYDPAELLAGVEFVDTLPVFRRLLPGKPSHALGAVAAALDCIPDNYHRGLVDCMTLARCVEAARDLPDPFIAPMPSSVGKIPQSMPAPFPIPADLVDVSNALVLDAGASEVVTLGLVDEATLALAQRVNALQPWLVQARALGCPQDDAEDATLLAAQAALRKEVKALVALRQDFTARIKPIVAEIEATFRDNGIRPLEDLILQLDTVRKPFAVARAEAAAAARARAEREAEEIAMAQRARELAALAPVQDDALQRALDGDLAGAAVVSANVSAAIDVVNDRADETFAAATAAAVAIVPLPVRVAGAVVRDKLAWRVTVIAPDRVPRHLCSPDLAKIQAAVDAAHGALVIDGVHVEVDVATTSRATRRG